MNGKLFKTLLEAVGYLACRGNQEVLSELGDGVSPDEIELFFADHKEHPKHKYFVGKKSFAEGMGWKQVDTDPEPGTDLDEGDTWPDEG